MKRALGCRSTILLILLLVPISSWGHAYLVKSSPARRAMLSNPPTRVVLWFNERLEAQFSQLSIWNAEGQQVDGGDVQVGPDDGKRLSVGIPALPAGNYTVKYRVLSVDGHIVEAEFPFTIRSRP
jgi:methionine-rich copper-binding protein CopC